MNTSREMWRVGDFLFDPATNQLHGQTGPMVLEPKTAALLAYLIRHPGRDISRDELLEHVWEGQIVSDGAINRVIAKLRQILGDGAKAKAYIVTVPKIGYRFVAHVEPGQHATPAPQRRRRFASWKILNVLAASIVAAIVIYLVWLPRNHPGPAVLEPMVRLNSLQIEGTPSPDGTQLVYSQRTEIGSDLYWLQAPHSAPQRIGDYGGSATSPRWAPDGRFLAYVFSENGTCHIRLLDMTTPMNSEPTTLASCHFSRDMPLAFSVDGASLYFSQRQTPHAPYMLYELTLSTRALRRISNDGSNPAPQNPTARGRGHYWLDTHPTDGRILVLTEPLPGETQAYAIRPSRNQFIPLVRWPFKVDTAIWGHKPGTIVHQGRHPSYQLVETDISSGQERVLVADSRRLMYPNRLHGKHDYSFTSYLYNRDITLNGKPVESLNSSVMDYLPTLSRDGGELAFISKRTGESLIYIADLETGMMHTIDPLVEGRALFDINWSFDDQKLLVNTSNELMIIDVKGGNVVQTIAPEIAAYGAQWSGPDIIGFSGYTGSRWRAYEYHLATGRLVPLDPRWSFVLSSPETKIYLDQEFRFFEGGREELSVSCAYPVYLFGLTMTLDGRDLYCVRPSSRTDLVKLEDLKHISFLEGALNPTTRHFAVSQGKISQAVLANAASDILRTRFPEN